MRKLLLPISLLYHIILKIRHKFYDWRWIKSEKFDFPVICVGNLCLGGSGKTPHTEYLIRLLQEQYQVALLSRGYGRKTKGFRQVTTDATSEEVGDEPLLYRKKYPDIQVAVDEDRVEGVRRLLESDNPPQVILLDDAFQHRKIEAGLNILLTEYDRLYCDDCLVPAGDLRDIRSAAQRVDIIVVSKAPALISDEEQQQIIKKLNIRSGQKVFFSYLEYQKTLPLNATTGNYDTEVDSALLFCGIAHPEPLIAEAKSRYKHLEVMTFSDHHPYTEGDIKGICKRYENMGEERKIILTTEKDAMRLTNSPYICQFESMPLFVLPVSVRFHEEEKFNKEIAQYVRQNLSNH